MSSQPNDVAAPPRRHLPGPLRVLLMAWAAAAGLGALAGLALAVTSLASGTPGTSPLERTGLGLFGGAFCGSLLAVMLVALYYATWALLRLGNRILFGSVGSKPAPGAAAGQPASNGCWSGLFGTFVGVLVGGLSGGLLGFAAIALWIGLSPSGAEVQAQAPFWGVVFGVLWGGPAGLVLGSLAGAVAGFVAGFRLGRRPAVPLLAA